jgi:hypothetical protein
LPSVSQYYTIFSASLLRYSPKEECSIFEPTSPEQAADNLEMFQEMAVGAIVLVFWLYLFFKVKLLLRK